MPVHDQVLLAAGVCDRRRSSEGIQRTRIGETPSVIADLGEHPGAGQRSQTGEAGDNLGVRVPLKMGDRRLGEVIGCGQSASNWHSSTVSWILIASSPRSG